MGGGPDLTVVTWIGGGADLTTGTDDAGGNGVGGDIVSFTPIIIVVETGLTVVTCIGGGPDLTVVV